MNSAAKAAILSVGLIAVIFAAYFFLLPNPSGPTGVQTVGSRPPVDYRDGHPPPQRTSLDSETSAISPVMDEGTVDARVRIVEARSGRPLSRSLLRVVKRSDTDSIGKIFLKLPKPGAARGADYAFSLPPGVYELQARCRGYAGAELEINVIKARTRVRS